MGLRESEAIVLRSYNLAEADKIILLLTQNEGVIRGVAKGAKRLKSQFGGSLEPFSFVNVTYFQKENVELTSIRQIDLVKSYFAIASDPVFLQKFAYLIEILIEFAPPHDPDERLFRMTKVCIDTAAKMPEALDSIAVYFEIWLLRLCGYLPNWNNCDSCSRELPRDEVAGLGLNFHLVCGKCDSRKSRLTVSPDQRRIFQTALRIAPDKFAEFTESSLADVRKVSGILRRIIAQILGREVVGEKILTALL